MKSLSGWGRYPKVPCRVIRARSDADVTEAIADAPLIARGNGRSYGDPSLNPDMTLDMTGMDRMLSFDADTGVLVAEAGVLLGDVITACLPQGWFPSVTPGTKFITLGGAIAADVHGKNHHCDGSFGAFVDWIDLVGPDAEVIRVTPQDDLFHWTLGGMGLTGVILRAQIRLTKVESAWIEQDMRPTANLSETMDEIEATRDVPYSVAWIDCTTQGLHMGRSLVMLGRHARKVDLPRKKRLDPFGIPPKSRKRMPIDLPGFALNSATLGAFNTAYYWNGKRKAGKSLLDWDSYFYPLDAILDWNRVYGRRGFLQFQCALPHDTARDGLKALMKRITASGLGSPLAVLKQFGPQDGRFSFPMPGYTLALDFPATDRSLTLMDRLDAITLDHGGRFYLAKDARMPKDVLDKSDPRAEAFARMRKQTGLSDRFRSVQSERLGL
ncbi:MAG: FAD-binding oxidoreductase [Pseudomonadota bacterium]